MTEQKQVKMVPCEQWTRVVGYLRPLQNFNKAMRQMFYDRKTFNFEKAVERADK
jgi:anaerobic ribonucleoside-triphosphate reductase